MDDEENGVPSYEIIIDEGYTQLPQRMIIIKALANGDVHAEDNDGQMIICRQDGTIQSFLHGDENWIKGRIHNTAPWDVIGFHLGMTNGYEMERSRNERTN